jgi:uncharacterized membrane protein YkvA (DUF1232 family)
MTVQSETTPNHLHEVVGAPAAEHGHRFYDRIREHIHSFVGDGKMGDFLLLVPDMSILLWRLANDDRVSGKNKGLLISGVAYFIAPFDIIPEGIVGPIGYIDDLVLSVFILNKILSDTDPAVLREHWSGHDDVLATIQKVLTTVDTLVVEKAVTNLRQMAK